MNYNRLETSLIDVIKEEQAKLGYMKENLLKSPSCLQHPSHCQRNDSGN